ncbi:MAG: hypothetical protein H6668_13200 [Ardenticatenaceae bacterium]|nr:hypothetical protein [Ardenticatenaceae bacterium]
MDKAEKLLLLLDGLDEATARRDGIMQQIKDFSHRFDQSKLVLTCRIAAVSPWL